MESPQAVEPDRVTEAQLLKWEGMVRGLASKMAGQGYGEVWEDLCQEGRLALVQFIPRVNGSKGTAATYLYHCVRGAMLRWWRDQGYTIRVAAWRYELGDRVKVGEMPGRGLGIQGASRQDTEEIAIHHIEVEQVLQTAGLTPYEEQCLLRVETAHEGQLARREYAGAAKARRKLRAARNGTPMSTRASARARKRSCVQGVNSR